MWSAPYILMRLRVMVAHWLTGVDGETYAIGRGMGLGLLTFSMLMTGGLAVYTVLTGGDVKAFLEGSSFFIPAAAGGTVMLVTLTNPTEPKLPPSSGEPQRGSGKPPWER